MKKSSILVLLGILLVVLVLGSVGLFFLFRGYLQGTTGNVQVENVKEEYIAQLNQAIVYTANATGPQDYYSPLLDLVLKYDPAQFKLSESVDYLSIFENNLNGTIGSIRQSTQPDVYAERKNYYNGFQGLVISEQKTDGNFSYFTVKYEKADLFDSTKIVPVTVSYIVFKNGSNVYYLEAKGVDINNSNDLVAQKYYALVKTVNFDTTKIDSNIKVALDQGAVTVSFDKKLWSNTGNYDFSVALAYFSTDKNSIYQALNINSFIRDGLTPAYLTDYVIKDRDDLLTSTYLKATLVKDIFELKAGENTYQCYNYSKADDNIFTDFTNKTGTALIHTSCFGVIGTKALVNASFYYTSETDQAYKDFLKVLADIHAVSDPVTGLDNSPVLANVLGTDALSIKKAIIVGQPSTVHIFSRACYDAKVEYTADLPTFSGKTYHGCIAGTGSGFYVTEDGYIITNSHVVGSHPLDQLISAVSYSSVVDSNNKSIITNLLTDINNIYPDKLQGMTNDELFSVVVSALQQAYSENVMSIKVADQGVYIENGKPFAVAEGDSSYKLENAQDFIKADIIDQNALESTILAGDSYKVGVADLALLKVGGSTNYPSIKLEDSSRVSVGASIFVIGFPGVADNKQLTNEQASIISTATTGSISSIKPSAKGDFNLLQIDASIEHGNSGGPIISSDARVVAVATYGVDGNGNFNFGVDSKEVQKMLDKNGVVNTQGELGALLGSGMDAMEKEYYKQAVDFFGKAKSASLNNISNLVDPLINISTDKINAGEDKTPLFSMGELPLPLGTLALIAGLLVIIVICTVLVVKLLKPATKPAVAVTSTASDPVIPPPAAVVPQPQAPPVSTTV